MRKFMFVPVAAMTAALALGAPILAQTTVPPASAPATAAPAASAVPQALTDLGATDVQLRTGKRGFQKVSGKLADGTAFEGMLGQDGTLQMIGAGPGNALPQDVIAKLVPETVRNAPGFAEFARVSGVGQRDNQIMIMGQDRAGENLRAGFGRDGTLLRFGRGDDDTKHKWSKGERGKGERGKGERDKGDRRGPSGKWQEDMPGMNGMGAMVPGPQDGISDQAALAALAQGGYTQPGAIQHAHSLTVVEAVNAAGEPVYVTIDPAGKIIRETAR